MNAGQELGTVNRYQLTDDVKGKLRKLKAVKEMMKDNVSITTIGMSYKVHSDDKGIWFLDDFGDKQYVEEDYFIELY